MIVTVSRQMGSLGTQVAEEAARRLGYRMVWRQVINQAALRAGVPEVALATIDELGLLGIKPSQNDFQSYHQAVRQIMLELANHGNVVIVGRAGQVILRDNPDAVHVRVIAPRMVRVDRVSAEQKQPGLSDRTAASLLDQSDHAREEYLRHYYQVDVNDPLLYDLVINTAYIDVSLASDLIYNLVRAFENEPHLHKQ
jgi:CMP/dCMP kinase